MVRVDITDQEQYKAYVAATAIPLKLGFYKMRFGAYEIKINLPRKSTWIWSKILAALAVGIFIKGMNQTHEMISYRS